MLANIKNIFMALTAVLVFGFVGGSSAFADDSSFAPRDRFFFDNTPRNFLFFDRFLFDDFDDDDKFVRRDFDRFDRDRFFFNRFDRDRFFFKGFDRDDDDD